MSPTQVLIAERGKAHLVSPSLKYKNYSEMVAIDCIDIGFSSFKVSYQFVYQKLARVVIQSLESKNPGINQETFDNLKLLLEQKYGKPTIITTNDLVIWKGSGTAIRLQYRQISGVPTRVTVIYTPGISAFSKKEIL